MGISSSKREQEEKEKKEQEVKKKSLETINLLEQKIKRYEELADAKYSETKKLTEEARKKIREGDKTAAKRILQKKNKIEKIRETLNAQITMLDDQKIALENAMFFGNIMSTLKTANNVLNQNKVTVEELEDESEKIKENKDNIGELNKVFEEANNENEDELSDELEKWEQELENEVKLPSANKESLKKSEKEDNLENDLNMLAL